MNFSKSDKALLFGAARVTVTYYGVFWSIILVQMWAKVKSAKEAKASSSKKNDESSTTTAKFNRYLAPANDLRLLRADRSLGNFLEYSTLFVSLLWIHTALIGDCEAIGFGYVFLRALYPILAYAGGITFSGAKPIIYLSTLPGYGVLIWLTLKIAAPAFGVA